MKKTVFPRQRFPEEGEDKDFRGRIKQRFQRSDGDKDISPNQAQMIRKEARVKGKQGNWEELFEKEINGLIGYGLVFEGFERLLEK